jgi:two-component system CheB/CheR fusion protein
MAGEKGDRTPERKRNKKPDQRAVKEYGPATEQSPQAAPPQRPQEEAESAATPEPASCPVVGVGASAGGLEALQGLFAHLPSSPGLAFVVVQHRAAGHASIMKPLIEMHTKLAVKDIEDGMKIEPDTIYLAPAEKNVSIRNDVLHPTEAPRGAGLHLPIDSFFRALGRDTAERAICIVLSGTGSDGTLGLKEIKAAGGMAMVQKPDQAKYDSMPRSAIETGMVDFILPVEEMGEQLLQYLRHPYLEPRQAAELEEPFENQLQKVLLVIRQRTGQDFSHYQHSTIRRRLATRLAVHHIENLDRYLELLRKSPTEAGLLARALLITVTSFFRDREAWEALTEHVIRPLVERTPSGVPLRAWVAGCATGEEAYTLALLFHEQMEKDHRLHPLQIFATDRDEESLHTARRGVYPKSIAADVSPVRLKRFFTEMDNRYRIRSDIRESIVFAKHDLTRDTPFSKLDLVCCRNVLIYMDRSLQEKLLPRFHYALNPGGMLFLGESESLGRFADLFTSVDARHKVFGRKPATTGYAPETAAPGYPAPEEAGPKKPRAARTAGDIAAIAERMILRDFSWPCVLIDEEYNIVYFNGDMGTYLTLPRGKATFNVLQMARPEIRSKLDLLLKRAFQERHTVVEKGVLVQMGDRYLETEITVRPVTGAAVADNLMLVVFESKPQEPKPAETAGVPAEASEQEKNGRIRALEQELQSTRQYLQTTVEELETGNEELKSSNEELQSTNEELQSTNEELSTSREELQSVNEELRTLNAEYLQKMDELSGAYDDLANLLGATEIATVFLDHELKIRRFTPTARKIFRLIDGDVGRPLDDIATNLQYAGFSEEVRRVLETSTRVEKEVMLTDGAWYEMKIFPYRTAQDVVDGVVITFVDISDRKQADEALRESKNVVQADLDAMKRLQELGMLSLQEEHLGPILTKIVEAAIAVAGADFGNIQLLDPGTGDLTIVAQQGFPPWWLEFWNRVRKGQGTCGTALEHGARVIVEDVERSPVFADPALLQAQRKANVRAVQSTPLVSRSGKPLGMFSTHYKAPHRPDDRTLRLLDLLARQAADMIEWTQADEAVRRSEERFRVFVTAISDVVYRMSPDWSEMRELRGRKFIPDTEAPSRTWLEKYIDPQDQPQVLAAIQEAIRTKSVFELEHRVRRVDGSLGWAFSRAVPLLDAKGEIVEWVGTARDITERKREEEALRKRDAASESHAAPAYGRAATSDQPTPESHPRISSRNGSND